MSLKRQLVLLVCISGALAFAQEQAPAPTVPPAVAPPAVTTAPQTSTTASPPTATATPAAVGGDVHGVVKAGNTPIPGVTVTAANTLTGKKVITTTDIDGSYALHLPSNGRFVVRAELAAFAPATSEVVINATSRDAKMDLNLMLASRAAAAAEQQQGQIQQLAAALANRGGFQSLSVNGGDGASLAGAMGGGTENGAGAAGVGNSGGFDSASLAGSGISASAAEGATESVSFSGNLGRTQNFGMSQDELNDRISELKERAQREGGFAAGNGGMIQMIGGGGGFGGFGGGPGGPGGGGPPMRIQLGGNGIGGFNPNKYHGTLSYTAGNSIFDAKPYSLTGQPTEKPDYNQGRFGGFLGGPLNIPKIYKGGTKTFFFGGLFFGRTSNPYDVFSTVPTMAERSGDFSAAQFTSGSNSGLPVRIFDPTTGQPFTGNIIPSGRISSSAQSLLRFIPLPNLPGATQNFHYVTALDSNNDTITLRVIHNFGQGGMFGPFMGGGGGRGGGGGGRGGTGGRGGRNRVRNNINFGFNYNGIHTDQATPFPTMGGENKTHGFNLNGGWTLGTGRFNNNLHFTWNRNNINLANLYTNVQNIAGEAGITGVSQNPFDYGVPGLSFTNFRSLRDISPQLRNDNTYTFSESVGWSRGKHSLRVGGDFRRILQDLRSSQNARGSFTFNGLATGLPGLAGTGYDFADFLLGLPQLTSIQSGANTYGFRANSWDLFVEDNWRATANLTFNLGLRYEYVSPFSEKDNRIVNLDVAPGFAGAVPVFPGGNGQFTGSFPSSLIEPDRNNFAPRVGVAWKAMKNTVVRAGYGINYNIGQYGAMVQQMAFQPPFAVTQTNLTSPVTILTLQNGFPAAAASTVTNNFAVDKNYALGYVQLWNVNVQREIRPGLLLNVGYNGAKGTRLDIQDAPNPVLGVQPYIFEASVGDSILHSGTVSVRKRLAHGLSLNGTYVYSKSIDNASSIGGGGVVVAQNPLDLAAERGLSSFDQRHRFSGDILYELPFGTNKPFLNGSGFWAGVLRDWQFSGDYTLASGVPFTPRVLGAGQDLSRGVSGSKRADLTGQPITLGNPTVPQWFNTAAFVAPAGPFGDARRNIIPGPNTVNINMAIAKTVQLKDIKAFEFRMQANNVFNTVHFTSIDTVLNSPTFGQVLSAGSMRRIQLLARYRF